MKEVIERCNWLVNKCNDKAITPDVKDDFRYLLEEIERLNNIINEIDFYIYEKMRNIYIRADGDIGKYSFKALEEVWHKVRELKGRDKQ